MFNIRWMCLIVPVILLFSCRQKATTVQPATKLLTEAVYASGTLVPENEYKVVATTEGFLQQSLIKEGDTVKKGQLLFTLDNSDQQAQVNAAAGIVAKTRAVTDNRSPAIKDIENRLAAARIHLQNDQAQYTRYKNLYEQNAISASNYDKYRLQFETTQHDVEGLQEQLKQQKLNSALQLQQASNQLSIAQTARANGTIKSYTDGVVFDLYKQNGDLIAPNQPIALIGSGKMIAKLLVDQDDLQQIFTGQQMLITMDAFGGKVYHASVQRIYPMLNKAEQSFRVDAVFEETLPFSMYGLNIEANIILSEKQKTMVIPKKALLPGDSVLVKEAGKLVMYHIKKGITDGHYVQVLDGLSESAQINIQP
jgi:HlyD family secretion protein